MVQQNDLYRQWIRLVSVYTTCNLTKRADILHAISGMASIQAQITGDTYRAGLWVKDLEKKLTQVCTHI